MTILISLIVPKNLKFSNIYYVPKYQKIEGGQFGTIKKFSEKKSHSAKKIQVKNTQICQSGDF